MSKIETPAVHVHGDELYDPSAVRVATFRLAEPRMWDFHFKGFGRLKWVDDHYEFEGDPHESAKVFAEYLASELNGRLK